MVSIYGITYILSLVTNDVIWGSLIIPLLFYMPIDEALNSTSHSVPRLFAGYVKMVYSFKYSEVSTAVKSTCADLSASDGYSTPRMMKFSTDNSKILMHRRTLTNDSNLTHKSSISCRPTTCNLGPSRSASLLLLQHVVIQFAETRRTYAWFPRSETAQQNFLHLQNIS